jgi:hypothetical protein
MTPTVAERAQMRATGATAIGMKDDRYFGDALSLQRRLDHHLRGELHSRAAQSEALICVLSEAAHATVDVVDVRAKPQARHPREHRVAPPTVEEWHRARLHRSTAALQSATLNEIVALAQFRDEARKLREVVAVVGVAHHDVRPAGRRDPAHERTSVAALRNRHHARAER